MRHAATLALALAAMFATAAPATAAYCLVDYETFAVRDPGADDHAGMADEQSARLQGWYTNGETVEVRGARYEKYGLSRMLMPSEVSFWGFLGSVPFMVEMGWMGEAPEIVYGLVNPADCEFQPYMLVP